MKSPRRHISFAIHSHESIRVHLNLNSLGISAIASSVSACSNLLRIDSTNVEMSRSFSSFIVTRLSHSGFPGNLRRLFIGFNDTLAIIPGAPPIRESQLIPECGHRGARMRKFRESLVSDFFILVYRTKKPSRINGRRPIPSFESTESFSLCTVSLTGSLQSPRCDAASKRVLFLFSLAAAFLAEPGSSSQFSCIEFPKMSPLPGYSEAGKPVRI